MVWDEARFGLALDLERFMIVAVGDFNMGAMENKGLNIFNTKYVLASPATATDVDFAGIESVVGHEYFHNWTGNRITCRDWFQLSLKEGLTVFRDQEFSHGHGRRRRRARAVKRIEDVRVLRQMQFPEDAGPMAHPVRPDSYVEINNFYTATVYEKGAEVVRMMQTLVGREGFAARHDAVLPAPRRPGRDLRRLRAGHRRRQPGQRAGRAPRRSFKRWYARPARRASTRARPLRRAEPHLHARPGADAARRRPGSPHKLPFVIPVAMGAGRARRPAAAAAARRRAARPRGTERVLVLDERAAYFTLRRRRRASRCPRCCAASRRR